MNALHRALAELPDDTRALYVGYSGGRDSSAVLHALVRAYPSRSVRALHVCHHLLPDAEAWAAHCARQCQALGAIFERIDVSVDPGADGLEGGARVARYAAFARRLGEGDVLVCAHHALDQAETFLLQALRGAGVAGLAAMPRLAPLGRGRLWRPWLAIDRELITAYAVSHELPWVEDESNADPERARGYLRHHVWPALESRWPAAGATLSRSAAWAAEAAEAVDALAAIDLDRVQAAENTLAVAGVAALSAGRARALLRYWLAARKRDLPDHRHLEAIMRLLESREHAGPVVAFAATEVRRFDGRLFALPRLPAAPAPGRRLDWSTPAPRELPCGCGRLRVLGSRPVHWPGDLQLVFRSGGERLCRCDGATTRLSERLRVARVPPWIRDRQPLVCAADTILAVPGCWTHPRIAGWFGGVAPEFEWRHALVGERRRVVGPRPLG